MGKEIDWVRQEASGRLLFRKRYPADVQRTLGKLELKIPLGAKWHMTEAAFRVYRESCERFDRKVRDARAAAAIAAKKEAAAFDQLTADLLAYLGNLLIHGRRTGLDQRVRQGHGLLLSQAFAAMLPRLRLARQTADHEFLEETIGAAADELIASEGLRLNSADTEGRKVLLWELSGAIVREGDNFQQHANGYAPPIPPKPATPANPRGGKRTVASLIKAYKAAKWDGWSQSSRTAVEPAFRVLRDAIGDKLVTEVDRDAAREVLELVKALPAALGRNKELKSLPIPEAVKRGAELGLPTIGPKTVNGAYMAHISGAFRWAMDEDWAGKNPFRGLAIHDPVADKDKRDPFTTAQLQKLFATAPWATPRPHDHNKPGQYWVPLIALLTGARLAEITGLRLMDIETMEGIPCIRIRPYPLRPLKTPDSRRDLPVPSALLRMGLMSLVEYRRKQDPNPRALLFPDGKPNVRGQWGAKLTERFGAHLRDLEIIGTKLGTHSFRHNVEDRLKPIGLYGRAEGQALLGRKIKGSEGTYGSGFTVFEMRDVVEKVRYPELDLSHLEVTE